MIPQWHIRTVSITQSNRQAEHGNKHNQRNKRRHADKKRRQFLTWLLREEVDDAYESCIC